MTLPVIPPILGRLSHDVMLVCDRESIIQEANPLALRLMGPEIVGKPLSDVMAEKSKAKGEAFLGYLQELQEGDLSEAWELFFQVAGSSPMPVSVRGGLLEQDVWLLVGGCEPPQLTTIYHEVLAINTELTNLIRQLSKEQARLTSQVNRLLDSKE